MSAWLLLLLAIQAPDTAPQPARVRWELAQDRARVGEPLEALVTVEHAAGARVSLPPQWLEADWSWAELAEPRLEPGASETQTSLAVQIASLEAGERELPQVPVTVELAGGGKAAIEHAARKLTFTPALFEGEDAPREPRDFRAAEPENGAVPWPWIAVGGALVAVGAGLLGWFLRGRKARPEPPLGAGARLAQLAARDLDDAATVREVHYELTAIVRTHIDQREGVARPALTDEEWLTHASRALDGGVAGELAELLSASRGVKYGGARPTAWAVRETLARAQRIVDGLPAAPRSAA